jgi:hypothetical protein
MSDLLESLIELKIPESREVQKLEPFYLHSNWLLINGMPKNTINYLDVNNLDDFNLGETSCDRDWVILFFSELMVFYKKNRRQLCGR